MIQVNTMLKEYDMESSFVLMLFVPKFPIWTGLISLKPRVESQQQQEEEGEGDVDVVEGVESKKEK